MKYLQCEKTWWKICSFSSSINWRKNDWTAMITNQVLDALIWWSLMQLQGYHVFQLDQDLPTRCLLLHYNRPFGSRKSWGDKDALGHSILFLFHSVLFLEALSRYSILTYKLWNVWKERNAHLFYFVYATVRVVSHAALDDDRVWCLAMASLPFDDHGWQL
jgi:hypothetical protein